MRALILIVALLCALVFVDAVQAGCGFGRQNVGFVGAGYGGFNRGFAFQQPFVVQRQFGFARQPVFINRGFNRFNGFNRGFAQPVFVPQRSLFFGGRRLGIGFGF